jgi:aerobic-type carbon monoxide dehydrogenase small subunit (CoxS/CutS family)
MDENISFTINGKAVRLTVDGNRPLLWVLRTDLGLTGAKYGCGEGLCGACTVLVNDKPVRSCQTSFIPSRRPSSSATRRNAGSAPRG